MPTTKRPTAVDLFCGAGGFSLGFLKAGIEVIAAVDNSIDAMATYYANLCDENTTIIGDIPKKRRNAFNKPSGYRTHYPDCKIPAVRALFLKDIFEISGWEIMDVAKVEHVDIIIGAPPCQAFSSVNMKKRKGELREYLLFEFGRIILEIKPDTFTMENVPGIVKAKLPNGRNIIKTFTEMTSNNDWDLYYDVQAMYIDKIPINPLQRQQSSLKLKK